MFKLLPITGILESKILSMVSPDDSTRDILQRCDILVTEDCDSVLCNSEFLKLEITFSGVTPSAYQVGMPLAYLWTLPHRQSSSPLHSQGLLPQTFFHGSLRRCALEAEKCLIF
jgi:hypothetical protein